MLSCRLASCNLWLKKLKIANHVQKNKFNNFSTVLKYSNQFERNGSAFQKGQTVHGFTVDEIVPIDEMHLVAMRLNHLKTGAQYLHIDRDDSNNVFSIGFRTTPTDSTGLPHVLEHVTLCGSNKFPVRDPFFNMLRRSLASFMNAMTGADYTMYPFSTQNFQDFKNLQSVYLDSVFRPKLRELDFRQEGWRLEHTDPNDKTTPIIFKGIVYNEMKGVFNNNQVLFCIRLMNSILPSNTYGVVSGGDPLEIPRLEHKNLLDFHATHYHPSNARFYSYGNFPLEYHLQFINDEYLSAYDPIDTSKTIVPSESKWSKPKEKHISCQPDPLEADPQKQSTIAIASLCNDITNIQETFDMYILSQLLIDGPNSAFYKSLIDTNIGSGFGSMTGYESQCKDTIFSVSLQGVNENDFGKIKQIYQETVIKAIENGFNEEHINTILHTIELRLKHQTSSYGLDLYFNLFPLWNHNGDIIGLMKLNESIKNFKETIRENPKYLTGLVEKYLLNNNHQLTLTMTPDPNYESQFMTATNDLLNSKVENLSKQQLEHVFNEGQALISEQQKKQDVECLPSLEISDLKKDVDRYNLTDIKVFGIPVQLAIEPTNDVCYYRGVLNTQGLSNELKSVLPIFNNVAVRMGTKNHDYRSWDKLIHSKTGGLEFSNHVVSMKDDVHKCEEGIIAYSHCLNYNSNEMWSLWQELFSNVEMTDLKRFETLVKTLSADLTNGVTSSGHMYAISLAASQVSPVARVKENLSGLKFINRMKSIAQMKDLSSILDQMQRIASELLKKPQLRSSVNVNAESKDVALEGMKTFYESLNSTNTGQIITKLQDTEDSVKSAIHYIFPYTVNYASKVISTVPYFHSDYAPLQVLSKLISSIYLHTEIREKGGAYGGGANISSDGCFTFYSYRDPNSTRTLDIFDATSNFLSVYNISNKEINEAKLGIFQKIDCPVSPSHRGMMKFLYHLTDDDIQEHRMRLKNVTKEEIMHVADKYLSLDAKNVKIGRSLIGPQNNDLKNRHSENWMFVDQEDQSQASNTT